MNLKCNMGCNVTIYMSATDITTARMLHLLRINPEASRASFRPEHEYEDEKQSAPLRHWC